MVKEGESGEVPMACELGDINGSIVPFTLLKPAPGGPTKQRLLVQPCHSALEGEIPQGQGLIPSNEGL